MWRSLSLLTFFFPRVRKYLTQLALSLLPRPWKMWEKVRKTQPCLEMYRSFTDHCQPADREEPRDAEEGNSVFSLRSSAFAGCFHLLHFTWKFRSSSSSYTPTRLKTHSSSKTQVQGGKLPCGTCTSYPKLVKSESIWAPYHAHRWMWQVTLLSIPDRLMTHTCEATFVK